MLFILATWALKSLLRCRSNTDFFIQSGGISVIASIGLAFSNDKDVMKAVKDVKRIIKDPEGNGGIITKIKELCIIN